MSAAVHLARILAANADYTTVSTTSVQQQGLSSSYMTPPAMTTHRPAQQQHQQRQQPLNKGSEPQQVWKDGVAYLAPALAFNMGLQHELWPLMPHVAVSPSDTDRQADAGAVQSNTHVQVDRQTQPQLPSASCSLLIRPLRQFNSARIVDVPQSGRS